MTRLQTKATARYYANILVFDPRTNWKYSWTSSVFSFSPQGKITVATTHEEFLRLLTLPRRKEEEWTLFLINIFPNNTFNFATGSQKALATIDNAKAEVFRIRAVKRLSPETPTVLLTEKEYIQTSTNSLIKEYPDLKIVSCERLSSHGALIRVDQILKRKVNSELFRPKMEKTSLELLNEAEILLERKKYKDGLQKLMLVKSNKDTIVKKTIILLRILVASVDIRAIDLIAELKRFQLDTPSVLKETFEYLLGVRNYAEAHRCQERLHNYFHDEEASLYCKIKLLHATGQNEEAKKTIAAALRAKTLSASTLKIIVEILCERSEWEDLIKLINLRIEEMDINALGTIYLLSRNLSKTGQEEIAIPILNSIMTTKNESFWSQRSEDEISGVYSHFASLYGIYLYKRNQHMDAIIALSRAVRKNPESRQAVGYLRSVLDDMAKHGNPVKDDYHHLRLAINSRARFIEKKLNIKLKRTSSEVIALFEIKNNKTVTKEKSEILIQRNLDKEIAV